VRLSALAIAGLVAATAFAIQPPSHEAAAPTDPGIPGPPAAAIGTDLPLGQVMGLASTAFTGAMSRRILGNDGRFTILLLGSDSRPSHPGLRTDAIIIASVDPVTGRAAAFSIPRDTVNFPLSSTRRFSGKLNALYQELAKTSKTPGTQLRKIIGSALGIEIDAYALMGFPGFRKLVDNVHGLDVYVARTFYDRTYSISRGRYGFGLKQGWHHLIDLRALAFARTRHADSDYERARRQQQLIIAAVGKVRSRGLVGLASLLLASRGLVKTDLPLAYAPLIFAIVSRVDFAHAPRTVFGPSTFAKSIGGYNNVLLVANCRAWIRRYFPPIHPAGAWLPPPPPPPPSPSPSPSPSPVPSASPSPSDSPAVSPADSPSPSASPVGP
jgi:LCP family protein required for cell wall assembly